MYAIIRAGGKQYKVSAGDTVRVEKIDKSLGDVFNLPEVLMVGGDKTFLGAPLVQNAIVTVVVTRQAKAPKVIVFKKKRRQGYRKMQGHRQLFTELFVQSITTPEGKKFDTDKKAHVIDPVKIEARKAAHAAKPETKAAKAAKRASTPRVTGASKDKPKRSVMKTAPGAAKKSTGAAKAKKSPKKSTETRTSTTAKQAAPKKSK